MVYEPGVRKSRVSKAPRDFSNYGAAVSWRFGTPGLAPAAWGVAQDFNAWKQVLDSYLEDNVEAAHDISNDLGIGPAAEFMLFLELLDLEYETGLNSSIITLGNGIECEYVAEDGTVEQAFFRTIEEEILSVRRVYETDSRRDLVCLLSSGLEIRNPVYRHGYYVKKAAYGKTCLPAALVDDPVPTVQKLRHAQASGIAYELSEANADRWFIEAATTLLYPDATGSSTRWRSPDELEACFFLEEETDAETVQDATAQSRMIGRFLLEQGGKDRLLGCLKEHAGGFGGRTSSECVKRIYGLMLEDLFHDAGKVRLTG